jgi:hypothetical protein
LPHGIACHHADPAQGLVVWHGLSQVRHLQTAYHHSGRLPQSECEKYLDYQAKFALSFRETSTPSAMRWPKNAPP